MPFYRKTENEVLKADALVATPNYKLEAARRNDYTYPVDGWYWHDTDAEASAAFGVYVGDDPPLGEDGLPADAPELVPVKPLPKVTLGNGMTLMAAPADRDAFTSLTMMVDLALRNGAMPPEAPVTFRDAAGEPQSAPAAQFLGLMLEYGSLVKALWDAGAA